MRPTLFGVSLLMMCCGVVVGCGGGERQVSVMEPADRFDCEEFEPPVRSDEGACAEPDTADPSHLVPCRRGAGHFGSWSVDSAGLPAYDFTVEQRCDPIVPAYSPRRYPLRDPIHLIGNGRGLVAMAHASGGVEIYSQDRGHKWINHIDTWHDEEMPEYPPQLGGGFNYYVIERPDGPVVRSTRFEDLPTNKAVRLQTRRFGVGYFETRTDDGELTIRRRVFAPDTEARALVAEVRLENRASHAQEIGLVEFWDTNLHQLPLELLTSDLAVPGISETIDRKRRRLMEQFTQKAEWDAARRVAVLSTTAKSLPAGVVDRLSPGRVDYFPERVYLAVLDEGISPDAVWLSDFELWPDHQRTPPAAAALTGTADSRVVELDGAGQHSVLAVRVPVLVPARSSSTLRFAFGYVPGGGTPDAALQELRAQPERLDAAAQAGWRERLVWAAFPGLPEAGVVQRELAWASYNALAHTTYDEYRGLRVLGQGGSYKYIHGMDGAMGDLALFAEAITLVDPEIARETLAYALASQHSGSQKTPWRFPYATTGSGMYTDVQIYSQRSDAYYFLPAAVGRYVGLTQDHQFTQQPVSYWPRSDGLQGSVLDHLHRGLDYALETLGFGARGLVAMGTGDYADGIASLADEPATPTGTSSTYNAGAIAYGFPTSADVLGEDGPSLADRMRELADSQSRALLAQAWSGEYFYRGFVDSGNPLAPSLFFLEPQILPVLAGIVDDNMRQRAMGEVVRRLETSIGALSNVAISATDPVGGPDQPLVGGIWPVANAWLSGAYARYDATAGWSSFVRNTLAAHASKYPDLWYGIWTGPDSFNGPDHARPGEADAHLATALTDYPALNMHVHTGPLRALVELAGIEPIRGGVRIQPRSPSETYAVRWPRLSLRGSPASLSGSWRISSEGDVVLEVRLPSGLRGREIRVSVNGTPVEASVSGDFVRFHATAEPTSEIVWKVER